MRATDGRPRRNSSRPPPTAAPPGPCPRAPAPAVGRGSILRPMLTTSTPGAGWSCRRTTPWPATLPTPTTTTSWPTSPVASRDEHRAPAGVRQGRTGWVCHLRQRSVESARRTPRRRRGELPDAGGSKRRAGAWRRQHPGDVVPRPGPGERTLGGVHPLRSVDGDRWHRLYGRLGFARVPERDWPFTELGFTLLGFRREAVDQALAMPASSFSIAWSMVNDGAFWRGGKSLKVARNSPVTEVAASTR